MKIIRYEDPTGAVRHAALDGDGNPRVILGDLFGEFSVTDETAEVARTLAPVAPAQILCIGLNYRKHAEETGGKIPRQPILFMKSLGAACGHGEEVRIPAHLPSHEVDYECELVVVIGRDCRNATRENALDYVLGYTCGNDISARDHQLKWGGSQWCRGKSFDTFAPMGPCLVTADDIADPGTLGIRTELNGDSVQDSHTSDMIFDVPAIIEYMSADTTLPRGTVLFTGTPEGVGMAVRPQPRWLHPGDIVTVEIERIGRLTNQVVAGKA